MRSLSWEQAGNSGLILLSSDGQSSKPGKDALAAEPQEDALCGSNPKVLAGGTNILLTSYGSIVGSRVLVKEALVMAGFPAGRSMASRFLAFVGYHPGGLPGGLLFVGCHVCPCSRGGIVEFPYPGLVHIVGGTYSLLVLLVTKALEAGPVSSFIGSCCSCALVLTALVREAGLVSSFIGSCCSCALVLKALVICSCCSCTLVDAVLTTDSLLV